jgi:hypothetical protein
MNSLSALYQYRWPRAFAALLTAMSLLGLSACTKRELILKGEREAVLLEVRMPAIPACPVVIQAVICSWNCLWKLSGRPELLPRKMMWSACHSR